ncbi:hypothetical protein FEM48_Zijuj12G0112100 [Ziziphus jujuba var. spinosa]|uniref:MORF/ORRM1/DAG-like MORF domain-containing protein n=1 Tax=Ziziphus jujuba var. spinosa TaxID=714518 RepID=A0A978UCZ5_ZIZJJ|nr:hypothetical protein FEM48_Zijuj12G0112100 [Ziziphus jujuba var. spinosa]
MATQLVHRSLPRTLNLASFLSRYLSTSASLSSTAPSRSSLSLIHRLRPLVGAISVAGGRVSPALTFRCFATNATSSSLRDPNPNWSNRPPKETILLDGCDFEHWLVVMEPPEGEPTRDEIIDSYIKTLAMVIGSEEEARMKIYSVSTRCYYAFGALVSEELSYKIKELPKVRWVLPDSYLDVKNKDYGGEPFINGQAVPYDPKYHEEWIRNNARANERNRRNDRPRNFDRSRNFERRRENMQNRDFQRGPPPMPNQAMQNAPTNTTGMPPGGGPSPPNMAPQSNMGGVPPPHMSPPNMSQSNNYGGVPPSNSYGGVPPSNYSAGPPNSNYSGGPPNSNYGGGLQGNNYGGAPPQGNNYGAPPQGNNYGGASPQGNNYGGAPRGNNYGGAPQGNSYGGAPQGNNYGAPQGNNYGVPQGNYYGGAQQGNGGEPQGNMGGGPPNSMGGVPGGTYRN